MQVGDWKGVCVVERPSGCHKDVHRAVQRWVRRGWGWDGVMGRGLWLYLPDCEEGLIGRHAVSGEPFMAHA